MPENIITSPEMTYNMLSDVRRELNTKLDNMEAKSDKKLDGLDKKMDEKLDGISTKLDGIALVYITRVELELYCKPTEQKVASHERILWGIGSAVVLALIASFFRLILVA